MLSSGYIMPTTSRPGKKFWNGRLSMQGEEQIVVMNTAHLIGNTNLKRTDAIKKFYKKDTRPDMIWQCWWCWKHDWQELARLSFVHWLADSTTMKLPVFWCSNICYILLLFGLFEMMSSLLWKHKAIHFIKHSLMSFQLLVCCEIWLNTVLWVVNCLFAWKDDDPIRVNVITVSYTGFILKHLFYEICIHKDEKLSRLHKKLLSSSSRKPSVFVICVFYFD